MEKYRVVLVHYGDLHFELPPPQELFTSYNYEDCVKFCKAYTNNNKLFFAGLVIQKQILAWEEIEHFSFN